MNYLRKKIIACSQDPFKSFWWKILTITICFDALCLENMIRGLSEDKKVNIEIIQ